MSKLCKNKKCPKYGLIEETADAIFCGECGRELKEEDIGSPLDDYFEEFPRHMLKEIVQEYGISVVNDPSRCEGLIRDFCGPYRKEINLLVLSLKDGIPEEFLLSKEGVSTDVLISRLKRKLHKNLSFTEGASEWAVVSWILALERNLLICRPLHFIWIVDCSKSMSGDKMRSLNFAIREDIPHIHKAADENPQAQVFLRTVKFSSGAEWHISKPTPVEGFKWIDLEADSSSSKDIGEALSMVAEKLKTPPIPKRALPPFLVLITDGSPTDDFYKGLKALMDQPWGKKAVRMAIPIGNNADLRVLQDFIGNREIKPMMANNPEKLVRYMNWGDWEVIGST